MAQCAELPETNTNGISDTPSVALDNNGNASVLWSPSNGVGPTIYLNRYVAAAGDWTGASTPIVR